MKKTLTIILASVAMMGNMAYPIAALAKGGGIVKHRIHRQQHRINHGIKSGELTRREARRLEVQHGRIIADALIAKSNDGHIGPREFVGINSELDHANRNIYRLKHNNRTAH